MLVNFKYLLILTFVFDVYPCTISGNESITRSNCSYAHFSSKKWDSTVGQSSSSIPLTEVLSLHSLLSSGLASIFYVNSAPPKSNLQLHYYVFCLLLDKC